MATTIFEKPMGTEIEDLKDEISTLNSNITSMLLTKSYSNPGNDGRGGYFKFGNDAIICYGHKVMPDSGAVTISFPITMTHVPVVVAQWSMGTNSNIAGDLGALKVYAVSTTTFNVTIGGDMPDNAKNGKLFVSWMAICS